MKQQLVNFGWNWCWVRTSGFGKSSFSAGTPTRGAQRNWGSSKLSNRTATGKWEGENRGQTRPSLHCLEMGYGMFWRRWTSSHFSFVISRAWQKRGCIVLYKVQLKYLGGRCRRLLIYQVVFLYFIKFQNRIGGLHTFIRARSYFEVLLLQWFCFFPSELQNWPWFWWKIACNF